MADVVQQYHPHDLRLSAGAVASGAGGADPFLVEVRAVLEGPDGRRTAVPGFYDGDGTWVVRVCPNERGTWRYTLESAVPALAGRRGELHCVASQNPRVHGALRVDPLHRHHFVYEDGERPFVLGYEANWLWALGFLDQGEARLRRFVEQIAGFGFNHVFVNAYAHDTRWRPGTPSRRTMARRRRTPGRAPTRRPTTCTRTWPTGGSSMRWCGPCSTPA